MGRGRKLKPKQEKELQGTLRKDRQNKVGTLPESTGKLGLPLGLGKTVHRHCSEVAKYLRDAGAPVNLIRPLFDRYCKHLQFAYDASMAMKKGSTDDGKKKPEAQVWRDESAAASKIEGQLLNILKGTKQPEKKADPLADFQAKGKRLQSVK